MPESEPAAERVVTELAGMPQPARRHQLRTAMAAARSSPRVCVGGGGGAESRGPAAGALSMGAEKAAPLRAIVYGYGEP